MVRAAGHHRPVGGGGSAILALDGSEDRQTSGQSTRPKSEPAALRETILHFRDFAMETRGSDELHGVFEQMHQDLYEVVEIEDLTNAASTWKGMQDAPRGQCVLVGRNEVILRKSHQALAEQVGLPLRGGPGSS